MTIIVEANRIQAWQGLSDWQLADRFDKDRPVLLLPVSWWSGQHEPEFESAGWWQKPTRRAWCKQSLNVHSADRQGVWQGPSREQ